MEGDRSVELRGYMAVLRKRWITVVLVTLAAVAVSAVVTFTTTPTYTAATRMFFSVQGGGSITDLNQGSTFTERQMASYAAVVTTPLVLEPVVDRLDLPVDAVELAETVTASAPAETVILTIEATDEDPALAADVANAVADQLAATIATISPPTPEGAEAVRATVLTPATPPPAPSAPHTRLYLALGLLVGATLGVCVAVLRGVLDTRVRTAEDVAALTASAVLGTVGFDRSGTTHPVFMQDEPLGPRAEAVRRVRTNLQFVDLVDRPGSIVVTSSVPAEGKSTVAINLAVALADAGARVVLVDADLRRPSVAAYLGLEGGVGLTTVLIGRAELADVVQPWHGTSLSVLPSGALPPNPSELLGSPAMTTLLAHLTRTYDIVVLDSPPLLPVADAAVLAKLGGGTLLVAGADRCRKAMLRESLEMLEMVGARVLGIVLNKSGRRDGGGYYSSYAPEGPAAAGRRRASRAGTATETRSRPATRDAKASTPITR
ncbi:polysaccharide biosynthesis tyrosine autokinase [Georgenia sp. SYP-B2076]|uniref:polysaccharide biosynthesis tyrosine autokinase n=1 Tax=Georgenia sp. SYP-B2076 TaxID=2495881 RepID=UPI000F8EEBFA|nr:polysaccharide biosynthesis tyrosine autokinase [Georgenia sp. SYP-B2076]